MITWARNANSSSIKSGSDCAERVLNISRQKECCYSFIITIIRETSNLPFLYNQVDVAQRHVLNLWFCRQKCHQRWRQLLHQHGDVVTVGVQHLHQLHDHLQQHHHFTIIAIAVNITV